MRPLALLLSALLSACGGDAGQITLNGNTMGTTYTVKLRPLPEGATGDALQAEIDQALDAVNRTMSTYDENSELSRFNRVADTEWVSASAGLRAVLDEALSISELSGGAFDVTVGPLIDLWGFGPNRGEAAIPSESAIAAAKARVGYRRLQTRADPPAVRKTHADLYVDLSAIAKGYGVDRVAELLDARAIPHYLVEIGGELRARGRNPSDQPWQVAIERPTPGQRAVQTVVQLNDQGLATSGDYRNFFELGAQRYSHIIDPSSGWPVEHGLASVTVIADTAMRADGLATALLVLGAEKGYKLAVEQNWAALFITIDGEEFIVRTTPAFTPYLKS